jgi:hypothetical protein
LRTDPLSITTEDARRLSEQVEVTDRRSAKIVSVVESLALASQDIQQLNTQTDSPSMAQAPRHAQHNLVNDLRAAVENYPNDVTPDLLKATQEIVTSKCFRIFLTWSAVYSCALDSAVSDSADTVDQPS